MVQPIKKLDDASLNKLWALENKLGCCIVALEQQPRPMQLSGAQLKELQAMEKEIGAILVAYRCQSTQ